MPNISNWSWPLHLAISQQGLQIEPDTCVTPRRGLEHWGYILLKCALLFHLFFGPNPNHHTCPPYAWCNCRWGNFCLFFPKKRSLSLKKKKRLSYKRQVQIQMKIILLLSISTPPFIYRAQSTWQTLINSQNSLLRWVRVLSS
jgi:hypothetical protein